MALSDYFSRLRQGEDSVLHDAADDGHPTKVLPRFLSSLEACAQPTLLDLGPVVGRNVAFFGEQLGCKILVEDVCADIDRHAQAGRLAQLPGFFESRFDHDSESVDGILCWDVFDYLDRASAVVLANELVRMLRPGGVLVAFFHTSDRPSGDGVAPRHTKHYIRDPLTLEHRLYPAACGKQRAFLTRDVERLFTPLHVTEQFLLKSEVREVLFRKPSERPVATAVHAVAH